jgi:hypothetical protein
MPRVRRKGMLREIGFREFNEVADLIENVICEKTTESRMSAAGIRYLIVDSLNRKGFVIARSVEDVLDTVPDQSTEERGMVRRDATIETQDSCHSEKVGL